MSALLAGLQWLSTPTPAVNYSFLVKVYALLVVITAALAAAQVTQVTDVLNGYWLVGAPCVPCLMYAFYLSKVAQRAASSTEQSAGAARLKAD